jgi:hypothetical protein
MELYGIYLHVGTEHERRCNIITCRICRKAKVSYGTHPPLRNPTQPFDPELVRKHEALRESLGIGVSSRDDGCREQHREWNRHLGQR